MATRTLNVEVISASGLKDTELIGKSDPYVVVSVGKEKRKTKPAKEQPETPVWSEELSLPVLDTDTDSDLLVVIRNDDTLGRDEEMGRVVVPLALIHGRSHSASTFPLELKGKPHGEIKMRLSFEGEGPHEEHQEGLGKKFQGLFMGDKKDHDYGEGHEVHHEGHHEEHHHEGEGVKEKFEDKIEGLKEKKHRKKHRGDGDEGSSSSSDDEKND